MVEQLNKDGFSKVHTEEVGGLPKWIRGDDEATITSIVTYFFKDHVISSY